MHCTAGKDRTGLVVCLILLALEVPIEAIKHDYMLSKGALESEREERLAEQASMGIPAEWINPADDMIPRTKEHLDVKYGGIGGYLDSIGFDQRCRDTLRELLLY